MERRHSGLTSSAVGGYFTKGIWAGKSCWPQAAPPTNLSYREHHPWPPQQGRGAYSHHLVLLLQKWLCRDLEMGRGREGSGVWSPTLITYSLLDPISEKGSQIRPFRESSSSRGLSKLITPTTGQDLPCQASSSTAAQPCWGTEGGCCLPGRLACFINLLSNAALLPRGSRRSGGSRRFINHDREETEV